MQCSSLSLESMCKLLISSRLFSSPFHQNRILRQLSRMHKGNRDAAPNKKKPFPGVSIGSNNGSNSTYVCVCVCVHVHVLSHGWLFAAPWTAALQASLPMEFSGQEYWSVVPYPTPGDLPHPGVELTSLGSPALAGRFCTTSASWEDYKQLQSETKPKSTVWV